MRRNSGRDFLERHSCVPAGADWCGTLASPPPICVETTLRLVSRTSRKMTQAGSYGNTQPGHWRQCAQKLLHPLAQFRARIRLNEEDVRVERSQLHIQPLIDQIGGREFIAR